MQKTDRHKTNAGESPTPMTAVGQCDLSCGLFFSFSLSFFSVIVNGIKFYLLTEQIRFC